MKIYKRLTLSQVFGAMAKHRLKSIATFVGVMLVIACLFLLWPRYYGSEGRLFVHGETIADPNEDKKALSGTQRETQSVIDLLESRVIVESVVDEIGPQQILENSFDEWVNSSLLSLGTWWNQDSKGMGTEEYKTLTDRERAASKLEHLLFVKANENSSVISVYCLAPSSTLAQRIVDHIMRETQRRFKEVQQQHDPVRQLRADLTVSGKELAESESSYLEFLDRHRILSVQRESARIENRQDLVANAIQAARNEIAVGRAREKLSADVDEEIKLQLAIAETSLRNLEVEQDRLTEQIIRCNSIKQESTNLLAAIQQKKNAVEQLNHRLHETRNFPGHRLSDVVIAQESNFLVKHVSPRGSVILPIGCVFAALVTAASALYWERHLLSGTLHEEEVEAILEMPVLVTLPRVVSQRNMVG